MQKLVVSLSYWIEFEELNVMKSTLIVKEILAFTAGLNLDWLFVLLFVVYLHYYVNERFVRLFEYIEFRIKGNLVYHNLKKKDIEQSFFILKIAW